VTNTRFAWLIVVVLLASGARGQTLSPILPDKFRDLTSPYDAKLISHFFGPAQMNKGETTSLIVKGPLALHVYRPASGLAHGGSVRVGVKTLQGVSIAEWTETVRSFRHPAYLRRLDLLTNSEVLVEVQVVDSAAGGPSGTPPYTLILEAWPLSASGVLREGARVTLGTEQAIRNSECLLQETLGVLPEFIEKVDSIERGDVTRTLRTVRTVTAGRSLMLRIPAGWASPLQPVVVNLYAKPVGDGPFSQVCKNLAVKSGGTTVNVVGVAPLSDESVWRIEFAAAPQSATSQRLSAIEVVRTKVLATPPTISHSDAWRHGLAHMCFDRTLDRIVEVPATTEFGGRSQLQIDLSEYSIGLSQTQREELHSAILQAVYLWVRSCAVCRLDNLVLVNIDGRTFAHPGLYGVFGGGLEMPRGFNSPVAGQRPRIPPLGAKEIDDMLRSGLSSARVGAPIQSQPYREVTLPLVKEFGTICAAKSQSQRHRTLVAVQAAVCNGVADSASNSRIKVTFNDGQTFCGNDKNIIACLADNELTELNVRDFRFRLSGPALKTIGRGTVEVDFLHTVLHEMGHWIGLGHIDVGESLMASSMEQSRCIDFKTVEGLARRVVSNEVVPAKPAAFRYLKSP